MRPRWRRWAAALALGLTAACATLPGGVKDRPRAVAQAAGDLTEAGLRRLTADMDLAMLALARRHDPGRRAADPWGRPVGWASLDLAALPDLGLRPPDPASAREINALRPFARLPLRPMRPFWLAAGGEDARRALTCLSQAVYYEAAREPLIGREAVAQVVLNRLRHPAYPKSVCGVVFQGAGRASGCQFSFTCDGSLRWAPEPRLWAEAQGVARRALAGFVFDGVGSATHYHADYVAPYWAPTLVKLRQFGAHIFYRWTGPWGEPAAFTGRYAGGEANLSRAILQGVDPRTQGLFGRGAAPEPGRRVTLAVGGEVRTYTVVDPLAPGGVRSRVLGTIPAARRRPTPEEVRRINESLDVMEPFIDREVAPTPASTPSQTPAS